MTDEVKEIFYGLPKKYKVICDETNNTPEDIENGVVNATIEIEFEIKKVTDEE